MGCVPLPNEKVNKAHFENSDRDSRGAAAADGRAAAAVGARRARMQGAATKEQQDYFGGPHRSRRARLARGQKEGLGDRLQLYSMGN